MTQNQVANHEPASPITSAHMTKRVDFKVDAVCARSNEANSRWRRLQIANAAELTTTPSKSDFVSAMSAALTAAVFTTATPIAIYAKGKARAFQGAEQSRILAMMARNTGMVPMMTGGMAAPASWTAKTTLMKGPDIARPAKEQSDQTPRARDASGSKPSVSLQQKAGQAKDAIAGNRQILCRERHDGAKILAALDCDARLSTSELALLVGMSAQSVSERARRLETTGVIPGFTVDVDMRAIGDQIRAMVRIRPLPGKLHLVERLIQECPEFIECDKITGDDAIPGAPRGAYDRADG